MKVLLFVLTALALVSCASTRKVGIPWGDGKYIEKKGTLDEVIFYEKDSVQWKVTLESRNENKFEYLVNEAIPITIEGVLDCTPNYEYQPTPNGEEGEARYKRVVCKHNKNFDGTIVLLTKCHKGGEGFTPVEREQLNDGSRIYLSCLGK